MLDCDPNEGGVLIDIDGRRLASRADCDDRRSAACNMPVDQLPITGQIETAIFVHRRDDCHDAAFDHGGTA